MTLQELVTAVHRLPISALAYTVVCGDPSVPALTVDHDEQTVSVPALSVWSVPVGPQPGQCRVCGDANLEPASTPASPVCMNCWKAGVR